MFVNIILGIYSGGANGRSTGGRDSEGACDMRGLLRGRRGYSG